MRAPWHYESPRCASVGGDFWFPEFDRDALTRINKEIRQVETQLAKSICGSCIHKIECQQWGLRHETFGVWGGLTESDRRPIRRRLNIIVKEVGVVNFAESVGNSTHESNTAS